MAHNRAQFSVSLDRNLYNRLLEYGLEHHLSSMSMMISRILEKHFAAMEALRGFQRSKQK